MFAAPCERDEASSEAKKRGRVSRRSKGPLGDARAEEEGDEKKLQRESGATAAGTRSVGDGPAACQIFSRALFSFLLPASSGLPK